MRFNGAYPDIGNDQLERYFNVNNHNRLTLKTYVPQTSSARMVYVHGNDEDDSADNLAAWRNRSAGWLKFEGVEAGHWELLEGHALSRVAEIISEEIARIADLTVTQQFS